MGKQLAQANSELFGTDGLGVTNFALFRGTNRDATAEQFAEQINRSLAQIEAGDYEEVTLAE